MKVKGILLNWIVVKDIEAAIKFYTEVVGLTLHTYEKKFGWAELSGPEGMRLGIAQENPMQDTKAGTNAVTTITVDDIQKACEEFKKKGVKLVGQILEVPGQVKLQSFVDKDGNHLQLVEQIKT